MMASILGEIEYKASVHIEKETEVLLLPVDEFRKWMFVHKPIRQMIFQQIIFRLSSVTDLLEKITFCSIHDRLAGYLRMRLSFLNSQCEPIEITHEKLAIELGTAREVISRALNDFARKGAISLKRGKIHIIDSNKLDI